MIRRLITITLFFNICIFSFGRIILRAERDYVRVNDIVRISVEFTDNNRENYDIEGIQNFDVLRRSSLKRGRGDIFVLRALDVGRNRLRVRTRHEKSNTIEIRVSGHSGYSSGYSNGFSNNYSNGYNYNSGNSSGSQATGLILALLQGLQTQQSEPQQSSQAQQIYNQQQAQQGRNYSQQQAQQQSIPRVPKKIENYLGSREDFKIIKKPNEKVIYLGEKIVYEETFKATGLFRNVEVKERPKFESLSSKDYTPVNKNKTPQIKEYESNGKKIMEILIYRGVVQGNLSGDQNFYSSSAQVTTDSTFLIPSSKVLLNIKPLPEEGKPKNFQGIVGKLKLDYKWDEKELKVGKTILLTVKISGDVNLDNLDKLNYYTNDNFNSYESLKSSKEEIKNGKYYSEKEFEIAFIPKVSGEILVNEFRINYFNPKTEEYEMKKIPPKLFNVTESENVPSTENLNVDPNKSNENLDNKLKEEDSNIKNETKLEKEEKVALLDPTKSEGTDNVNYGLYLLGGLGIVAIGALYRYFIKNKNITGLKKYDNYWDLKRAKSDNDFYEAYMNYMVDKYNFNPKLHSEIKLKNDDLKEVNLIMEKWKFKGEAFDRNYIIEKLKAVDNSN
ncbi:MAG: BatD family protein [Fusobacteriaceae bacterium]